MDEPENTTLEQDDEFEDQGNPLFNQFARTTAELTEVIEDMRVIRRLNTVDPDAYDDAAASITIEASRVLVDAIMARHGVSMVFMNISQQMRAQQMAASNIVVPHPTFN